MLKPNREELHNTSPVRASASRVYELQIGIYFRRRLRKDKVKQLHGFSVTQAILVAKPTRSQCIHCLAFVEVVTSSPSIIMRSFSSKGNGRGSITIIEVDGEF